MLQTGILKWGSLRDWSIGLTLGAIAAVSAFLLVTAPTLFAVAVCIVLVITAFFRFDLFAYAIVFLLPWYPFLDVNFPVRDIFVITRFLMFAGVFWLFVKQGRSIRQWIFGGRIRKAILIFAAIAVVSLVLSGLRTNTDAYKTVLRLYSYMALFYALAGWLERREQFLVILRLLLLSTILVALFGFYQVYEGSYTDFYFKMYPLQLQEDALEAWSGRITSFLFHFNSLAGYLNLVIPFAVASVVLPKAAHLRTLGWLCLVTANTALFFTQSRGGLLAWAATMLVCIGCSARSKNTRIGIIVALVLAVYMLAPGLLHYADRLQEIDQETQFSRLALWGAAVSMFLSSPLLGIGYGNYRVLYGRYLDVPGGRVDSHNLYLQLLAETGVIGFLAFLVIVGCFIRIGIRLVRNADPVYRALGIGITGAMTSLLVHGLVDYLFTVSPQFGALFWTILGVAFAANELVKERPSLESSPNHANHATGG